MTKLQAINKMLAAINEAPVTQETSQHPDVLVAVPILDNHIEQVQAKGYWFNKEDITLSYEVVSLHVILPPNTLAVDPVDNQVNYVRRGNKLYDVTNNTFEIGADVKVHLVLELDFEDLPVSAQVYISARAAYELHLAEVGDNNKLNRLDVLVREARGDLRSEDIRNSDYNARLTNTALNMMSGIIPYGRR